MMEFREVFQVNDSCSDWSSSGCVQLVIGNFQVRSSIIVAVLQQMLIQMIFQKYHNSQRDTVN